MSDSIHPTYPAFEISELARRWPAPLVARDQRVLDRFSGGLLNARTLANADSAGTGPKGRVKIGRKVAYPAAELVAWMRGRMEGGEAA